VNKRTVKVIAEVENYDGLNIYIYGRIILKWILNEVRGFGLDSCGSRHRSRDSSCEHGQEFPCSVKGREFVESLSDYQLLVNVK
jgi:hypothetical protein